MIERLKADDLILKVGGRYRLTALIQKRWLELLQGSRPLIEPGNMTPIELIVEEIRQGKLTIDFEASHLDPPSKLQ
ncbi:MAG: DNA-directed RNA polymerase subunit omega [Phycisphaerae bacterium]|nr:DNA-directed RNA polymerase subunit omega [Phycisphaerae bacterium]NUQ45962.1 DNA-directed RNA polymerase subunit omega [Phycisphaerae bacterium]